MPHERQPECGNPRLQRLVLRVIAAVSFIALPAIFVPRLAVEKFSVLLGFGKQEASRCSST